MNDEKELDALCPLSDVRDAARTEAIIIVVHNHPSVVVGALGGFSFLDAKLLAR